MDIIQKITAETITIQNNQEVVIGLSTFRLNNRMVVIDELLDTRVEGDNKIITFNGSIVLDLNSRRLKPETIMKFRNLGMSDDEINDKTTKELVLIFLESKFLLSESIRILEDLLQIKI